MRFAQGAKVIFKGDQDKVIGEITQVREDSEYPYRVDWEAEYDWDWFAGDDLVQADEDLG